MKNLNFFERKIYQLFRKEEFLEYKLKLANRDKAIRKANFKAGIEESQEAIDLKTKLHPLLLKAQTLNRRAQLLRYNILEDHRSFTPTDRPIIFAVTHIGKFDIEIVGEAIQEHFYLLSADQEQMYHTIEGKFLDINGVAYFDYNDPEDAHIAKAKSTELLLKGQNLMWYPEGTWNLSPNLPVLPIKYGIIEPAHLANALILPIAVDQVGIFGKSFNINIADYIDVNGYLQDNNLELNFDTKVTLANQLRDELATQKWKLWEAEQAKKRKRHLKKEALFDEETMTYHQNFPVERNKIPNNYYNKFLRKKEKEWPHWEIEDVITRASKYIDGKKAVSYAEVFGEEEYPELVEYKAYVKRLKK